MKKISRFPILFLLVLPMLTTAQSSADRSVLDTELQRFHLMTTGDTVALRAMIDDDLVYIHSNTMTESKDQHIAAISGGKLTYHKMDRVNVLVRRYGKTAITNGLVKVNVTLNGKYLELPLAYTAVYRKKKGKWLLVNWQSTKVP